MYLIVLPTFLDLLGGESRTILCKSIKGNFFYSLDHFPTSLKVCHVSSNKLQENGWYIHSYVSIHKIVQLLEVAMFLFSEDTPILMEKNHHKTGTFFDFFTEQSFYFLIHSAEWHYAFTPAIV